MAGKIHDATTDFEVFVIMWNSPWYKYMLRSNRVCKSSYKIIVNKLHVAGENKRFSLNYRFVGGEFFENVFFPKGSPKNSQK